MVFHDVMGGTGEAGTSCTYTDPVTVNDGTCTITGFGHDSGKFHSTTKVSLIGGSAVATPLGGEDCPHLLQLRLGWQLRTGMRAGKGNRLSSPATRYT